MAATTETLLRRWEVVFEGVGAPDLFAAKLQKSQFHKRSQDPVVSFDGAVVKFVFSADLNKNAVQKKCSQTFSAYGSFACCRVVELSSSVGFLGGTELDIRNIRIFRISNSVPPTRCATERSCQSSAGCVGHAQPSGGGDGIWTRHVTI